MNAQQSPENITGTYFLHGVMETASVIELNTDSSFRFFYSYGSVDRYGSGKWSLIGHDIILNSRQRPPVDFKLIESKTVPDDMIRIQIVENNKILLQYVQCMITTKSGSNEAATNSEGIATFPKESIDSIALIFRLCPDRYSVFKPGNKDFNFFQFGFEPWIAEIFFDHLKLRSDDNVLSGQHPLLKGENFKYSK
jgi:hypothetical protein